VNPQTAKRFGSARTHSLLLSMHRLERHRRATERAPGVPVRCQLRGSLPTP